MKTDDILYVGLKSQVLALENATGKSVWTTALRSRLSNGDSFVTLLVDGEKVFAHTKGELFCLDAISGTILWAHKLPKLGFDIASLATSRESVCPNKERVKKRDSSGSGDAADAGDGGCD